jgi:hypothetical protein
MSFVIVQSLNCTQAGRLGVYLRLENGRYTYTLPFPMIFDVSIKHTNTLETGNIQYQNVAEREKGT